MKLGIIGCGAIAREVHTPSLLKHGKFKITALCDLYIDKINSLKEKFVSPAIYTNYIEMLSNEKLDAVYVLVRPDEIFRIAYECINRGLHVFCEKPAGITTFQAKSLAQIAKSKSVVLQVGLNRRYIPLVNTVLDKIGSEINQAEVSFVKHSNPSFYGGCESAYVCDSIHSIDLLRYITKAKYAQDSSTIIMRDNNNEYAWNSVMRFDNGVTGIIKANYKTGGRVHSAEIHSKNASAYINLGFGGADCNAKIIYSEGKGTHSLSATNYAAQNIEFVEGSNNNYYEYYGYLDEAKDFYNCIANGHTPRASIDEAVLSMALSEKLLKSEI